MKTFLRPRNNEPYLCLICGSSVKPGSLIYHLAHHHTLTVAQYREQFNIPSLPFRFKKGNIARKGTVPHNKLPVVIVPCYHCGKVIEMLHGDHKKYVRRKCNIYCSKECNKLGRSKSISIAKKADAINIGRKSKVSWKDPKIRKKRLDGMLHKNQDLEWVARRIAKAQQHPYFTDGKFKNTSIELKMQAEFERNGLVEGKDFFKQFPTCGTLTDFYFPATRTIVECDGDYWHNLPENKLRDAKHNKAFAKNNFKVFRFWEHEINSDVQGCFNKIREHIHVA